MGYRLITGRRALCVALLSGSFAIPCIATPYWVAWEGDDWPENQGWTRSYGTFNNPGGGQAVRTLANGELTIDGMQGTGVYDDYSMDRPGAFDPGPGEMFVAQWRMRVDAVTPPPYGWDPSVGFLSETARLVLFAYSADHVWELATNVVVPIAPSVFHSYEFRSPDMLTYQFFVDDVLILSGLSDPGTFGPRVAWGDGFAPSESRSTWDYVRFGVVPECVPMCQICALSSVLALRMSRGRDH